MKDGAGGEVVAGESSLRVIRPNLRQRSVKLVAQGSLAALVKEAERGELRAGDLVVGLLPDRPVAAHEVAELRAHVPGPEEAELLRTLRAGIVLVLLVLAVFAAAVALIPGAPAALMVSIAASLHTFESYASGVFFALWTTFAAGRQYERWSSLRLARRALLVSEGPKGTKPPRR